MKILIEFCPPINEITFLEEKLFQYNRREVDNYSYEDFIIKVIDDSDLTVGGIHCQIGGDWLYIASLWIDENVRSEGLGKRLLRQAEEIAVQKKCFGVYLYTYSFQNPGFYEKVGYHTFGMLENFCNDNSKLYMKKYL